MRILISEKLSPHKYKTPEGYLICTDAVLARTGLQTYKRSELFACDDMREIEVNRTPEEVFSQATLASFENKPISIDHPDEEINVDNYGKYAVGFMRDIRRGKDNGQDVIIGDLVITDKTAIDLIESGEYTELSCGYDCDIKDEEHPCQRNIRGNHLALCRQGRAGNARIVDSINDVEPRKNESKEDFISRFMSETKEEYPDEKQRLAVAYSYWNKKNVDDGKVITINNGTKIVQVGEKGKTYAEKDGNVWYVKRKGRILQRVNTEIEAKSLVEESARMGDEEVDIENLSKSEKEKLRRKEENKREERESDSYDKQIEFLRNKIKELEMQKAQIRDTDYSKKTRQGYDVIEMYRDGGRIHAIVKRQNDYVVALGYDESDGTWAQGRYVDKYENALATLKEEKPYARKIQDCDVTDSSDIYRSFNYMLNTYSMQKDILYSIVGKIKSASDLTKEEKDMLIMKANSLISSLDKLGDSVKDETPSKEVTKNLEKEVKDSGTEVLKMGLIAMKAMKSMKK